MAKKPATAGAPSQRMLRVAEEVRHALSAVFLRGELHDPDLDSRHVTVTEVRSSPDLRHMTCFVSALGRATTKEELAGLRRLQPYLRTQVARAVRLRFAPELHFQPDTALEYAMKIDAVMRRPEVAQDLPPRADKPGAPMPAPRDLPPEEDEA
ncbi:30S ribosome-binding factor RbfA [Roseomonas sp. 18066]|uniref:30S ribosome-binding factor RbfA n=1 Tax=Roseomonas sp. 18066 TaxID=2681412 RepID=UPI00135731D4|nr:30S ribosome-binding factor RbfA [Roseomonas sp. 18066]